jgi:hypothetical protein
LSVSVLDKQSNFCQLTRVGPLGQANFFQIGKFLGLFRYAKSANVFGLPYSPQIQISKRRFHIVFCKIRHFSKPIVGILEQAMVLMGTV